MKIFKAETAKIYDIKLYFHLVKYRKYLPVREYFSTKEGISCLNY